MTRGEVSSNREPRIDILVANINGEFQSVNTVLDTGFTGWLTLPPETIRRLGLIHQGQRTVIFANDLRDELDIYQTSVQWQGRPRRVIVFEAQGQPLLGMSLLWGSRVILEAVDAGNIVIEELNVPQGS